MALRKTTADLSYVQISEGDDPTIPFHTYLWKIASRCNLNCTYCYVYNSVDTRWHVQPKFMSKEVAHHTALRMREHLDAHNKKDASIIFHGGEPLLGGVDHLDQLTQIIAETFVGSGIKLTVGMQSNLLLFTPEIGDFMLNAGMSIGISIDGPPEIHNIYRVDHLGQPTAKQLEAKLELLTSPKYRPIFSGILCVINPYVDPIAVTKYLLSYGPPGIDFLFPLNNHDRRPPGKEHDISATPYGDWLINSFDYWLKSSNKTQIRIFNSIIGLICGAPTLVESLGLNPVDLIVVETNGDIEAVDSLKTTFEGATWLGYNVFNHSFETAASNLAVRSRQMGVDALCQKCKECSVVNICGGGYLPHRYSSERRFDNPSVYSADLEKLIRHIHKTITEELKTSLIGGSQ